MNEKYIAKMFKDYVAGMEDMERHTEAAVLSAEELDAYLEQMFSGNIRLQGVIYDKAMDMAVEFEESGFIAGFKGAMQMFVQSGVA